MNAFFAHLRIAFRTNSAYRLDSLLGLVSTCLQVFISCAIWRTLFGTNSRVSGISFAMVATNFVLAQGLGSAFVFNDFAVRRKLADGSIAMDMLRPVSFRLSLLASNLGDILFTLLTRFAPTVVIACLFIGMVPPASLGAILLFCISTGLGFAVLWALSTVVQMTAFWIINVWSVSTIKNVVVNVFSGAFLPLWFLPKGFAGVVRYTPFDCIYFIPIRIYLGQVVGAEVLHSWAKQVVWFIAIYTLATVLWHRGKTKVFIQGG
jgi:ABC-2 type transport system permease protein